MITFDCHACNQSIEVDDEHARQEVECPFCESVVVAPAGTKVKAIDKPAASENRKNSTKHTSNKTKKRSRRDDEDRRWGPRDNIYDDDNYSKPFHQRWSNPEVAVGILGMIGAVIWFVLGFILLDRIYIYPPIMFILSLLALLRGLGLLGNASD